MKFLKFMIIAFALSSNGFSDEKQGVPVKTDKRVNGKTRTVRMVLGDNSEAPVIDIGPEGPVVLVFPGKVAYCTETISALTWQKAAGEASSGDSIFNEIIFNLNIAKLSEDAAELLKKKPVAIVCKHEDLGKTYFREILVRLNEHNPHRIVFFENPEKKTAETNINSIKGLQYITVENGEYKFLDEAKEADKKAYIRKYIIKDGKMVERERK